ncbi:thioesterase superfamily protein [Tanacetum coccineum]
MSSTARSSPTNQFGDVMQNEFRLKGEVGQSAYEVAKEKDRRIMILEEMKFLSVLIDDMVAGAAFSITGGNLATVDVTMSFYSTVKFNDEVEIEASVVGAKGNLVSVIIDMKKKGSGEPKLNERT